ncbi:MAG: hypothetical protein VYA86_04615 [Candidatus Thermoplasmatota archaeon]|nr:hypothetical protein [Candidatus Thermoplasmatota archaeon]
MRMRAMSLGLLLIVLSVSSVPGEQLESTGSITDSTVDWEGEATPTHIYEGVLSDPQDTDNISLGDSSGVVHSIHLVHADEPLKIEVRDEVTLHGEVEGNTTSFLISGHGVPMWIKISNANFTSPNSYRILVHSNTADEDVELGDKTASGYIHEFDNIGDRTYFTTGGNAEIRLQWLGGEMTEFVGHMTHISTGEVTALDFGTFSGNMTILTPDADSRYDQYEFSIFARTDAVAESWSINKTIMSLADASCHHDCPSTFNESVMQNTAFAVENSRWETSGYLSQNDSVDVYPIFILGEQWETHRVIASISEGSGATIQLQSWNNSGEFLAPLDVANGNTNVGLNMTPGYHLLKVIRADDASGVNAYQIDIQTVNITAPDAEPYEGEMVDRWREFIPFYIGIGLLMLAPLGYVLWSSRGSALANEVQAHERGRLKRLKERLERLIETGADQYEIDSALKMLEEIQWRATIAEMGQSDLTHHTESMTLKAWKISGRNMLIGIHVENEAWELAALRFVATDGPSWKIAKVSPTSLFDGDEIFLDTLEVGATRFVQLELEGSAAGLDLQLSGLVGGKPLAAIPARALLMNGE